MHSDVLPQNVMVSNTQPRRRALILKVLGRLSKHTASEELIARAYTGQAG